MSRYFFVAWSVCAAACLLYFSPPATAVQPAEKLLPGTTKGYFSIPDVDRLREHWNRTQLGHLVQDPAMAPFAEDLRRQIKEKLTRTGVQIGLTLDDLEGVYGGEVCAAAIQPGGDPKAHAVAMIVDVTGHLDQAKLLLEKIEKNHLDNKAVKTTEKIGDVQMLVFKRPPSEGKEQQWACYFIKDDQLVATDHRKTAVGIYARMSGEQDDALDRLPAFRGVLGRCAEAAGDLEPDLRWFVEPFGYVEVVRADQGARRKRGTDMLKIFRRQGFDAIQGVGGHLNFAADGFEILHRTMIYAPPVKRSGPQKSDDKYNLAARMLDFPNAGPLTAEDWVPRGLATYLSFNWKMKEAFEYSATLVNAIAGDDEVFDAVLRDLKIAPDGPKIDIRKDLVAHLGRRASLLTDYRLPIDIKSERMLAALEVTDPEAVAKTIEKAMKADPDARKVIVHGHTVWEILNEPEEEEVPAVLVISGPGDFDPLGGNGGEDEDEEKPMLPNSAVTVAHGHLMVATHIDFLKKVLENTDPQDTLTVSADYQAVQAALDRLGASDDAFRFFSRTDEEYRPTYELIRQGKMPEAETMLARLLNRLLGPDDEDILREQQIDGSKLPDYQMVRRYLGPAGMFVKTETAGWFMTGFVLPKDE